VMVKPRVFNAEFKHTEVNDSVDANIFHRANGIIEIVFGRDS